jgi:hypothetical protein
MLKAHNQLSEATPNVWVVTVNWNQAGLTRACVHSLRENNITPFSLLIVDNGSTDQSIEILQQIPADTLIQNPQNLGFAGGFNTGIKYALAQGADYVFMVNNDTLSQPQMLDMLVKAAQSLQADIAAPAVYYANSPERLWSAGGKINPILCAPIDGHSRKKTLPGRPVERDFLTGCALLIHHQVFDKIGFFDEGFFLYYEDLDFFMRAKNMGLAAWLIPQAKLLHHVGASTASENRAHFYYWMGYSSCRYFHKHAKLWQWFFILPWRFAHTLKLSAQLLFSNGYKSLLTYLRGVIAFVFKKPVRAEGNINNR